MVTTMPSMLQFNEYLSGNILVFFPGSLVVFPHKMVLPYTQLIYVVFISPFVINHIY